MSVKSTKSGRAGTGKVLFSREVKGHAIVVGADVLAADPDWLFAVAFDVGEGRTELIGRTIARKPEAWPNGDFLHGYLQLFELGVASVGHLTTAIARSAATTEIEQFVLKELRAKRSGAPSYARMAWSGSVDLGYEPSERGRLMERAKLARRYVELFEDGNTKPQPALAEEWGMAVNTVTSYLHQARKHKLLTSNGRGKVGGELTPKAIALLAEEGA